MFDFKNMRLSVRIYIQQFLLLFALIAATVYTLFQVNGISDEMTQISQADFPLIHDITLLTELQLEQAIILERIARLGTDLSSSEKQRQFELAQKDFYEHQDKIEEGLNKMSSLAKQKLSSRAFSNEKEREIFANIVQKTDLLQKESKDYLSQGTQLINDLKTADLRVTGNAAVLKTIEHDLEGAEKVQEQLVHDMEGFLAEIEQGVLEQLNSSNEHAEVLVSVLIFICVISVVIGGALTVFIGMTLSVLKRSVDNIAGSVLQVATAADQSSNAISTVADGAKQQKEAISQAVTAVDQSAGVITEVSTSAEESTAIAKESAKTAENGITQMKEMVNVVKRISENSNQISKITEIISNIASQTNMLSLNAAIEAARAGEHGKGFAVVAEQVRKLAESSKSSVQDIVDLVNQANNDSEEAVRVANKVNEEMLKISQSAAETEKVMQNIATSMEQQVATIEELQHNMDTLKDIGNNNANASEEITETIVELSRIANDTNTEVNKFNL